MNVKSHSTKETELLSESKDLFGIYQLKDTEEARNLWFEGMDFYEREEKGILKDNYELIYVGDLRENEDLEDIFVRFNINLPDDFTGHSLSVGDIVVLNRKGEITANFVDDFGFKSLENFWKKDIQKEHTATDSTINAEEKDMKKKMLQLDMDGTLANLTKEVLDKDGNFHISTLNKMMKEEDFFYRLTPFENMILAVKNFIKMHPEVEVSILSTAMPDEPPAIPKQKGAWLDKHLPEITNRYFVTPDVSKGDFLKDLENCDYYLVDDYNVNLEAFEESGGTSIKMLNSYNGGGTGRYGGRTGSLWEGATVSHDDSPEKIVRELERVMGLPEREFPQEYHINEFSNNVQNEIEM